MTITNNHEEPACWGELGRAALSAFAICARRASAMLLNVPGNSPRPTRARYSRRRTGSEPPLIESQKVISTAAGVGPTGALTIVFRLPRLFDEVQSIRETITWVYVPDEDPLSPSQDFWDTKIRVYVTAGAPAQLPAGDIELESYYHIACMRGGSPMVAA